MSTTSTAPAWAVTSATDYTFPGEPVTTHKSKLLVDGNVIGTVDQLDFHQADGSTNREPLELCLIADTDIGRMDICLEDAKSLLRILPILIALADKKPLTRRTGTGQPEAAA